MKGILRVVRVSSLGLLLILLPACAWAQAASRSDVPGIVDFSVTLKTVARAVAGEAVLPAGRLFILGGTVSEIVVPKAAEGEPYRARIRLLSGEWVGADPEDALRREDVKSYACYIAFNGPQFSSLFLVRPPANPPADVVIPNSRVMTVVRPLGVTTDPDGYKLMAFEGLFIRVFE
jgi:hypothetical protein